METFGKKIEMNVMNMEYWKSHLMCHKTCFCWVMDSLKDFNLIKLWSGHKDSSILAHLARLSKNAPL
jgi:hypothetical protein